MSRPVKGVDNHQRKSTFLEAMLKFLHNHFLSPLCGGSIKVHSSKYTWWGVGRVYVFIRVLSSVTMIYVTECLAYFKKQWIYSVQGHRNQSDGSVAGAPASQLECYRFGPWPSHTKDFQNGTHCFPVRHLKYKN